MTVRQALIEGAKRLGSVPTPFLDAIVLLSHVTGYSKEKLFSSYPEEISVDLGEDFNRLINLRLKGTPVSYIRRKKEFYGLEFTVGPGVLVPRPETELLVEAVADLASQGACLRSVHDACTGSGCVAISIKRQRPHLEISASDVSDEALSYFRSNSVTLLEEELVSYKSDLLESVPGTFDLIAANPPYLTSESWRHMAARQWPEPRLALDGGWDGLALYRDLIPQSSSRLKKGGFLFLEADPSQFETIEKLLVQNGFHTHIIYKDLAGHKRVIRAEI